jgi:undecaprenyl phosphate-alpha-L-ara4FN deformylase
VEVALKIDVDTHDGLRVGVPRMAAMLQEKGVTASFFVAMGPDNSGKAVTRAFRNRGFITKMFRTRAVAMYGWRTVLSGTLLPARPIALAYPTLVRDLSLRGFEVGIHGYDHVRWQDHIDRLGETGLRQELLDAVEVYRAIMHDQPHSFAAPGWRTNAAAQRLLDTLGLRYQSNTRGTVPYRMELDGAVMQTPEIPTTLPTLDEVLGRDGLHGEDAIAPFYLTRVSAAALNVHTVHAETEGMGYLNAFALLIDRLKAAGATFVRLDEAASALPGQLPICSLTRRELPGRAGWIAAQGEVVNAAATMALAAS